MHRSLWSSGACGPAQVRALKEPGLSRAPGVVNLSFQCQPVYARGNKRPARYLLGASGAGQLAAARLARLQLSQLVVDLLFDDDAIFRTEICNS